MADTPPKTIGITSGLIEGLGAQGLLRPDADPQALRDGLDRETRSLLDECARVFDRVLLIRPTSVSVEFDRLTSRPRVWHGGEDISNLSALIVRNTRDVHHEIHVLVQGLDRNGCVVVDPITRFRGQRASKLDGTADRWDRRIGTTTWIVGLETWRSFLDRVEQEGRFPLILKPLQGSRGVGVRLLEDRAEAEAEIANALPRARAEQVPFLVQEFVPFETEWRVTVVNGRTIGTVERIASPGVITHNAATGAEYSAVSEPEIEEFVRVRFPGLGIVGVDVARTPSGELHIIEANRGCEWRLFEDTTGVNVAREIAEDVMRILLQREGAPTR